MAKRRIVWFGRLHAATQFSAHPVTWQGWLATALFVLAEVATAVVPGLSGVALWGARAAIFVTFLIVAFATRDPNLNV